MFGGQGQVLGLGRGFNILTQYVVRIETLIRGFCMILYGGDFVRGGILSEGIMSGGDFFVDSK